MTKKLNCGFYIGKIHRTRTDSSCFVAARSTEPNATSKQDRAYTKHSNQDVGADDGDESG